MLYVTILLLDKSTQINFSFHVFKPFSIVFKNSHLKLDKQPREWRCPSTSSLNMSDADGIRSTTQSDNKSSEVMTVSNDE